MKKLIKASKAIAINPIQAFIDENNNDIEEYKVKKIDGVLTEFEIRLKEGKNISLAPIRAELLSKGLIITEEK